MTRIAEPRSSSPATTVTYGVTMSGVAVTALPSAVVIVIGPEDRQELGP